ncbi:ribonuclease HII [Streptosporangium saharense]|uniref:Ribonuclease HII n=1 Tax=Streptosporangium saharense TaxID=1706840 RepID=A0A7W7VP47_9ACTN|nr:ribonuclease HII [Streptosporangium saharense]MBB4917129.1 ribonuclease HII [Streptosporangium saharense]
MPPTYALERLLSAGGSKTVAGIDEVGRGAWAGPVAVCAVVTDLSEPPSGLTDSKMLTPARRTAMFDEIVTWAVGIGYGEATPEEIDELGMTEALRRAAGRALAELPVRPDVVILDGKHDYLGAPWPVRCEIKGDLSCVSVAAASVVAKVRRDTYMASLEGVEEYGFADNAGYPSPTHQQALAHLGPTKHHRLSWSYLDDLPQWRHLKRHRNPLAGEGQLGLFG